MIRKVARAIGVLSVLIIVGCASWIAWTLYSFTPANQARNETALLAAISLHPHDPTPHAELGRLYGRRGHFEHDPAIQATMLKRSHDELEIALKNTSDGIARCWLLPSVAQAAFEAGEKRRAESIARDMVKKSLPPVAHPWEDCNRGNSIHIGHMILGRVALTRGDRKRARAELLLSGQTPGSPNLNSFGPNMSLANDLLQAGERECVLAYFEECRKFWNRHFSKLDNWSADVKAGRMPEFGANLYY